MDGHVIGRLVYGNHLGAKADVGAEGREERVGQVVGTALQLDQVLERAADFWTDNVNEG